MAKEKKEKIPEGKVKTEKPNISQAGIMKALKARGFKQETEESPYVFVDATGKRKVIISPDKAVVQGTNVSVPLGKGAIIELMKQIETL